MSCLSDNAESDEPRLRSNATLVLFNACRTDTWIESEPVPKDHVGIAPLHFEAVVVQRLDLFDRRWRKRRPCEIHHRAHVILPYRRGHFVFSFELRVCAPNSPLAFLGFLSLEYVAPPGTPVRMAIKKSHVISLYVSGSQLRI